MLQRDREEIAERAHGNGAEWNWLNEVLGFYACYGPLRISID